jgi:hypothetical protein
MAGSSSPATGTFESVPHKYHPKPAEGPAPGEPLGVRAAGAPEARAFTGQGGGMSPETMLSKETISHHPQVMEYKRQFAYCGRTGGPAGGKGKKAFNVQ